MQEDGKKYRLEHDSIGEKEVPEDAIMVCRPFVPMRTLILPD